MILVCIGCGARMRAFDLAAAGWAELRHAAAGPDHSGIHYQPEVE